MKVELSVLNDGRVMLVTNQPMPHIVQRIEYYREQRLFNLVWHDEDMEEMLLHSEIPIDLAMAVERVPEVIICMMFPEEQRVMNYKTPLVKVGESF